MDEFLYSAYKVSVQLLPVLGVVALIFILVLLKKCIHFFTELENRLGKVDKTIDLVDQSLDKIQAPLQTAVNISKSVDQVHDLTATVVKSACGFVVSNMEPFGEWVNNKFSKGDEIETPQPPKE